MGKVHAKNLEEKEGKSNGKKVWKFLALRIIFSLNMAKAEKSIDSQ